MKTHTGNLSDRYVLRGVPILRVRSGNGPTVEVRVPAELTDEAAKIYGGGRVSYCFRGGRAVFVGYPTAAAHEVALRRPDLAAHDAIATVLTTDPTLTADEVIGVLDQAAADYAAESAE